MATERMMPLYGIFDENDNLVSVSNITEKFTLPGGGAAVVETLSANKTLTVADADKLFVVTASIVVTVPVLSPNISVTFQPTTGASVTLHPTGGTLIDGVSSDQVRSVVTDPIGFSLVPTYGTANVYGTTAGVMNFAKLGGAPTDNTALAAALTAKADLTLIAPASQMNGVQKMTTNFTVSSADIGKLYYTNATVNRTLNIPAGLPLNFTCRIAKFSNAAGAFIVAPAVGVTIYTKGGGLRLTGENVSGVLRCIGELNEFYIDSQDMVV
jgi:hypothetical protein